MHYSGIQIKKIPYKFIQNNILSVWHTLYKDWGLENTSWAVACSITLGIEDTNRATLNKFFQNCNWG